MLGAKSNGGGVRRGGHGKAKSRSLTPLAKRASGFGMTIFRLGAAKGPRRGTRPPATVRGRYICLRAIDARRGECYVAHEKPQVEKADPSSQGKPELQGRSSARLVRHRFVGNSDRGRKSTARNGCATGGESFLQGLKPSVIDAQRGG